MVHTDLCHVRVTGFIASAKLRRNAPLCQLNNLEDLGAWILQPKSETQILIFILVNLVA